MNHERAPKVNGAGNGIVKQDGNAMSLTTNPTRVMAIVADELCELTPEVIRPRLEDLLDANELNELRAQAAAAVVVMIRKMAETPQVGQTYEFIR